MKIELKDKYTYWCGDEGVGIHVRADRYTQKGRLEGPVDIYIKGMAEPTVAISMASAWPSSKHKFMSISDDNWIEYIHDWVEAQGLRQEWVLEVAKYLRVLDQVDLPCSKASCYTPDTDGGVPDTSIFYNMFMGSGDLHIFILVSVRCEGASVHISLHQEQDYRENYMYVGEHDVPFPVNTTAVRVVVGSAVTKFMGKVNALLDIEPVAVDNEMYII